MARNGFKKLLANVRKNGVSQDENGEWTVIHSSTNKARMQGIATNRLCSNKTSDFWVPNKVLLTEEDLRELWNRQDGKCYWFGIDLHLNLLFHTDPNYIPKHPLAPSVDKLDIHGDYSIDNVVICCRLANFGRNICPADKFRDIVDVVMERKKQAVLEL